MHDDTRYVVLGYNYNVKLVYEWEINDVVCEMKQQDDAVPLVYLLGEEVTLKETTKYGV